MKFMSLIAAISFFPVVMISCSYPTNGGLTFENLDNLIEVDHTYTESFESRYEDVYMANQKEVSASKINVLKEDSEDVKLALWSQNEAIMALIVISATGEYMAIYDAKSNEPIKISDEWKRIIGLKWGKQGDFVDFMVPTPSPGNGFGLNSFSYALYRYDHNRQNIQLVEEGITLSQSRDWLDL